MFGFYAYEREREREWFRFHRSFSYLTLCLNIVKKDYDSDDYTIYISSDKRCYFFWKKLIFKIFNLFLCYHVCVCCSRIFISIELNRQNVNWSNKYWRPSSRSFFSFFFFAVSDFIYKIVNWRPPLTQQWRKKKFGRKNYAIKNHLIWLFSICLNRFRNCFLSFSQIYFIIRFEWMQ